MAVTFGVTSTADNIVLTDFTSGSNAEIAEARDQNGAITNLHAYSVGKTVTAAGFLSGSGTVPQAGSTITAGSISYLVESSELVESNTDFQKVNLSLRTADSATLSGPNTSSVAGA